MPLFSARVRESRLCPVLQDAGNDRFSKRMHGGKGLVSERIPKKMTCFSKRVSEGKAQSNPVWAKHKPAGRSGAQCLAGLKPASFGRSSRAASTALVNRTFAGK